MAIRPSKYMHFHALTQGNLNDHYIAHIWLTLTENAEEATAQKLCASDASPALRQGKVSFAPAWDAELGE